MESDLNGKFKWQLFSNFLVHPSYKAMGKQVFFNLQLN